GFINLEYTSLVDPAFPACISPDPTQHCTANQMTGQCECCLDAGSTVTVKTQLGAGDILFGTQMMVDATAFDPDCQPFVTPVCLARPGGPRIAWISDTTIKTTCLGVTISTGIADNTPIVSPGSIPFNFTPTLIVPENSPTPPGFCELTFDLKVIANAGDSIFQLARYDVAACNNGNLVSGGAQTSKIQVCPEQGPFIGYELKDQGIMVSTGGSMDVPILGLIGAPVPPTEKLTARRLLAPAQPGNIFGDHMLAFSDFDLPLPNPKPTLKITPPPLGTFTGLLGGRSFVVINAVKDLVSQPPAQPLTSVWACYNFSKSVNQAISWVDQFGPNAGKTKGTRRVCLPASLLGSTPPGISYLCASNFPNNPSLFPKFLFVGSAWLSAKETIDSVDDYCVPATVEVQ